MTQQQGPAMIEARGLSKYFGDFAAIEDVTLPSSPGRGGGLSGPQRGRQEHDHEAPDRLSGARRPGAARIAGHDMATDRLAGSTRLGYLPENGPLYPDMTPRAPAELLRRRPRAYAARRSGSGSTQVVDLVRLGSVIGKPIGKLSRGYRQRVGMAQVLLHEPDVLILDEPTAGLDPNQIHEVRETIRKLGQSKTILLSTHILQEVEAMASRVLFINEGRLIFDGPIKELTKDGKPLDEHFRELTAA